MKLKKLLNSWVIETKGEGTLIHLMTTGGDTLEVWFPTSQIKDDERGEVWVPDWLIAKKQEEENENFMIVKV